MKRQRIIIMGAAGRDFHNFNMCYRHAPGVRVIAFTAAQIPYISNRRYPVSLAGELYPRGIPIYDEIMLPDLIRRHRVDRVVFAYSDISYEELMHRASIVLACGADFTFPGPSATMLKARKPVISVCAVRTGCGKSQVTRYLCNVLRDEGLVPVVVRHPMPYGELQRQEVERFSGLDDLSVYRCSIEEREEYEPLLRTGAVVYAGIDYEKILRNAEKEGDIILWDGGNNDFPFFCPDLEIVMADPLRYGDETGFFPGEVNLRRAQLVVINKANTVVRAVCDALERKIRSLNASAAVIRTASQLRVSKPDRIRGRSVLVIEDGPSITHGGLPSGAGHAAAIQFGAKEIVDPRPFAAGSLIETFAAYPHMGFVLPAMGYSSDQISDLMETIERVPCDLVVSATPIDLNGLFHVSKPIVHVFYDIAEYEGTPLKRNVLHFLAQKGLKSH